MKVEGARALVFGGTSGIGLAAANQLRALGAQVVVASRNPDATVQKQGAVPGMAHMQLAEGISVEQCDMLDREAVGALFSKYAPVDILVACVAVPPAPGPLVQMDLAAFQKSFEKVWGYTNMVQLGHTHLSPRACVVLVSGSPARRTKRTPIGLAGAGAAIEQMARLLAREIAPMRVNVVCPGIIDTPMVKIEDPEVRKQALAARTEQAGYLIPRAGTADEVAQGILFVIQNDFVTGTTVDVDGGAILEG